MQLHTRQQCNCRVDVLLDHIAPQSNAIAGPLPPGDDNIGGDGGGGGTLNVDRVVRVENFGDDLQALCNELSPRVTAGLAALAGDAAAGGGNGTNGTLQGVEQQQGEEQAFQCRELHLQASEPADMQEHYRGPTRSHCLAGVLRYYCWDFVHLRVTLELPGGRRARVCPKLCRELEAAKANR